MDMRGAMTVAGVGVAAAWGEPLTGQQILDGADARIEQLRKREAVLVLTDAAGKPVATGTGVTLEQVGHHFLFGCNLFKLFSCRLPEENAAYERQFAELFNQATLPFYWWDYEPEPGGNRDARSDRSLAWCREHAITPKGHPLLWNYRDPKWLPDEPGEAMRLQMARIARCMTRFEKDILLWDVLNEATEYDRVECKRDAPILTEAIRLMGVPAYLKQAFVEARRAYPRARLTINDYKADADYESRVLSHLVDEKGAPLYDIIGLQSHMHGGAWDAEKTWQTCEAFAKYGKPLHFTETTLVSGPAEKPWKSDTTPEGEAAQAEAAAEFYTILFSHPAVEAITWWDLSDQGAWGEAAAGLLRKDMTPKPAYARLKQLIRGKWWTRIETRIPAAGRLTFRGFQGRYRVSAVVDGRPVQGFFDLVEPGQAPIRVVVNGAGR
jgi:GH35 family endo-1,4-beta-xylanase